MNEIFDVVNENDEIVSKATYSECHEKGLIHRGSTVVLFKDKDCKQILILTRSSNVRNPGKLTIPGGHVSLGQSYKDNAIEELKEEVFHNIDMPELYFEELFRIKKIDTDNVNDTCNMFIKLFKVIYNGHISIDPNESKKYDFYDILHIFDLIENNPSAFNYSTYLLLKEYKKKFNKF